MRLTVFRRRAAAERGPRAGQLFRAYFPAAFAYVFSNLGDQERARDVVTEAFGQILTLTPHVTEKEFRIALFSAARRISLTQRRAVPIDFGLSARERDALTLTFDARMTLAEAERVCGTDTVREDLERALRKLRAASIPAGVPNFFQAS